MSTPGTLIFFCGKMAAGKSTTSKQLEAQLGAILISEDDWLSILYPAQINTFDDYRKYSAMLKPLIKEHTQSLLSLGMTVILDFPGNTKNQRQWFKDIVKDNGFSHRLIYLQASDEVCLSRLALRRESQPQRAAFDNEQVFRQVTSFFEEPLVEEGFNLEIIEQLSA